jgi:hypothetical protein
VFGQLISVSSLSIGLQYRKLYPDGEYVKNTNLPNYDFRWRIEIFPEKAWRISIQPGVFSRLYSLHDEMYDNSFTRKRFICPAISLNFERYFKKNEENYLWSVYAGVTISNLVKDPQWQNMQWMDLRPYSYYLQAGGQYKYSGKCSFFAQFNYPWIRNLNYLPINVGLGSNNTSGGYLSTPTPCNECWSITAGVVYKIMQK